MFRNLKLRNKLIAIIAPPLVALVAFAAIGAFQRRSTASSASFDGHLISVVRSATSVTADLQAEAAQAVDARLLSNAEAAATAKQLRGNTDAAIATLNSSLGALDVAKLDGSAQSAVTAKDQRLDALSILRSGVDSGSLDWASIAENYRQTVTTIVVLIRQMATQAHDANTRSGLTTVAAQEQVVADVSAERNQLQGVLVSGGWTDRATEALFAATSASEDADLAVFEAAAPSDVDAAYRTASFTSALAFVDATRQAAANGDLTQALANRGEWATAVNEKVAVLRGLGSGVLNQTANANAARVHAASSAALLFALAAAAAVLLALLVAGVVAQSLARRMRTLADAADRLSGRELPRLVAALENPDQDELERLGANLEPIDIAGDDELGRLAGSFNQIQRVAVDVATQQAALLQRGIADTFIKLARRNQSLLDRQIEFIDQLEMSETDAEQLEDLFRLDHLATRMRRNAESLLVLAGAEPNRRRGEPVPLVSVVRAAIGEVEDFARVDVLTFDPVAVTRSASVDVTHLLAELMDNATAFSPPDTRVEVAGHHSSGGGYVLSITDQGIGMTEAQLREANDLLAAPPAVGLTLSRSLGFIVVGRLADRFGIEVRLLPGNAGGITAVVTLPGPLVAEPQATEPAPVEEDVPPVEQFANPVTGWINDPDQKWDIEALLAAERPDDVRELTEGTAASPDLPRRTWRREPEPDERPLTPAAQLADAAPAPPDDADRREENEVNGDVPLLPVADARAPLRFGDLPARSGRRAAEPDVEAPPEAPATPEGAPARAPIRFRDRPDLGTNEPMRFRTRADDSDDTPERPTTRRERPKGAPIRFGSANGTSNGGSNGDATRSPEPPPAPGTSPRPAASPAAPAPPSIPAAPAASAQPADPSQLPVTEPVPIVGATPGNGLARRRPGAARAGAAVAHHELPTAEGEVAVGPSKRSAEERRSVLTSYRGGLDRGRTRRGT